MIWEYSALYFGAPINRNASGSQAAKNFLSNVALQSCCIFKTYAKTVILESRDFFFSGMKTEDVAFVHGYIL